MAYLLVICFFSFFCNHVFIASMYKKAPAVRLIEKTKPINGKPPPASPPHGNHETPRVHQNGPPQLAPKILYPRQVSKQNMEMSK